MRAHTLIIVLASLLLTACGQKGPLYLPAEPEQAPAAESVNSEQNGEQDKEKSKQSN